ncbi:tetratricopeptide repeat protein [Streptomyces sp. TLI_185]|uniref:tetratricopeptide repeat protein n=1 Tax=Streptomyces sp. TLI_185 TaxID=2485151 RepID=UPI0021A43BF7|nr:tetratricopeptide repeat protein [Streptomyces sp. TLI_185]
MATAALPGVPAGFTGREDDLARLLPVLKPTAGSGLPVVICAVSGLGGVGKTSLALYAGHQAVRDGWFPGGTLFVDLRGYDEDPVTADQALVALLDGFGIRGTDLPQTSTAQYALYRTLLAAHTEPMLLVLDNASDPDQLTPLIPGADRHRVLITSRDRLTDLPARQIDLDALKPEDAAALIAKSLLLSDERDDRAAREPGAVAELAAACGFHPLALRVAAGALRKRRYRTIASFVDELRGSDDRSGALGLRPIFEKAYEQLSSEQRRLLRLLCLAPVAEVSTEVAVALADLPTVRAVELLEELSACHLVTPVPTGGKVRWRLHDLVRAFGVGVVEGDAGFREEGDAAQERVLGFYLRWASAADDWLRWLPGRPEPERFADRAGALAWLDGERGGLVAAVLWAREERYTDAAVRLSQRLGEYLNWRRYFDDWITLCRVAREAAHRAGDRVGEASAWNNLGLALRQAGRAGEAIDAHTRARDLCQAAGDRHREAGAWNNLGIALQEAGQAEQAIDAHTRALDLYQAMGDRHREAKAWTNLGPALQEAGQAEQAIDAHTRALDLYQAMGDRHREAIAWNNLGIALQEADRVEEAIEAYGKALEVYREFGDGYRAGHALSNLALAHEAAARPAEARAHYLQAADAYTRANAPTEAANSQSRADALT